VECACGWGGPGDPLEKERGLLRLTSRLDRRLANAMTRRDFTRLRGPQRRPGRVGGFYAAILFLASTLIYLLMVGLLALGVFLTVTLLQAHAWFAAVIGASPALVAIFSLFYRPRRPKGIEAPIQQYPRLAAALAEVSARVGAPIPHRVVLVPGARAYVFQHRPMRRLFRREFVLGLGAGALPLLSDLDLKAILAHELAHYRHADTALHKYFGGAETALRRFIDLLAETVSSQRRGMRTTRSLTLFGNTLTASVSLATAMVWLITLPFGLLWFLFHLLRLAESRAAEFAADRVAAQAYSTQAFADGLTGLLVAGSTLRGAWESLLKEMRQHGGANLYEVLRRHYAGLPPAVIAKLRTDAARGFRSLEHTHPITPDRLRAVFLANQVVPPSVPAACPAVDLIVPAGATNATEIEQKLTALLLK
jgi:Zn-dependent protease with chaperone function